MKVFALPAVAALTGIATAISPSFARIMSGSASEGLANAVNFQLESQQAWRDRIISSGFRPPQTVPGQSTLQFSDDHTSQDIQSQSTIQFSNAQAQDFFVDGTTIPEVTWDAGPSWAGLLPISGDPDETRQLFFWFWPTTNASNVNDLVFWTQGGPGCSSLQGLLQENGPISWNWGQSAPTPNPWSWTNLANVIWVEQPIGTGFTQGQPNITNEYELAAQLTGFMQQFLKVFGELKGSNFYLSGESYGGFYVPYIANHIYQNPGELDLNLKGIWLSDPTVTWDLIQHDIPVLNFVNSHPDLFPLNGTFMQEIQQISDDCGYTGYIDEFVTYPQKSQLPLPSGAILNKTTKAISVHNACKLHGHIQKAISIINPVFNIYRASDSWPELWSILGTPVSTQQYIYFNRTDAYAIHAPHIDWHTCVSGHVFTNGTVGFPSPDTSVPSALSVLPSVIEHSEKAVILHGQMDFLLIAEGTRMAIQNMTWNGIRGFERPIERDTFLVDGMGAFGSMHTERNLTYVEVPFSGHMAPQFVPWATYQTMQFLLGQRDSPSA